jgi:hypothetical protein
LMRWGPMEGEEVGSDGRVRRWGPMEGEEVGSGGAKPVCLRPRARVCVVAVAALPCT